MDTWPVNPALFSVKALPQEDLLVLHKQQGFTNAIKDNGIAHVNKPSVVHLNAHTNPHTYAQAYILIK